MSTAIFVALSVFVFLGTTPTALAVPFVYLTQNGSTENAVHRIDVSGGPLQTIQGTGLIGPIGVDVDLSAGKVYWTDQNLGRVQRKNLDGDLSRVSWKKEWRNLPS
jgi:hypothetical protein